MSEVRAGAFGEDHEKSTARTGTQGGRFVVPRLLHYSTKPIAAVRSVAQGAIEGRRTRHDKPTGLWVSVEGEDDWRSWCEAESFGNPRKQLCYEVTLSPSARIKRISSCAELRRFTRTYGFDPYLGPMAGKTMMADHGIEWARVAEQYDGIIIAPYQHACRFDPHWYYGWDCASGCIWRAEAVAALKPARDATDILAGASVPAVDRSRSYPKHAVAVLAANPQEDETDAR